MTDRDSLPVIIGAGQAMRPVPDDLDKVFGPAELASEALTRAFEDASLAPRALDVCYAVRLFTDSGPTFPNPFGGSNNFPASVCVRAGASAKQYIYPHVGGETPQTLVAEAAGRLMRGEVETVAILGGEAAANIRAAIRAGASPDWVEFRDEALDDKGPVPMGNDGKASFGGYMIHPQAISHRVFSPAHYYALMETARRAALGETREQYDARMSDLLTELAIVADANPYAFVRQSVDKADITRSGVNNPMIMSPYTKAMIARDGVNLAAALLMTTYGTAKRMGVPTDGLTFLHAHDDASEPPLITRALLDRFGAQERVLNSTGRDGDLYDLYSCFPIVPLEARRILGLTDRPATLTGGLPFFGGPGNNYSLHAIAEAHARVRGREKTAVIYANGGMSTAHAVGRYSGVAPEQVVLRHSAASEPATRVETADDPSGTILTYTVEYKRGEPTGVVIIAETADGARFYARAGTDHALTFIEGDPIGAAIKTQSRAGQNMITGI